MPKFKTKKRSQKIHKINNKKFNEKEPQNFNYMNLKPPMRRGKMKT